MQINNLPTIYLKWTYFVFLCIVINILYSIIYDFVIFHMLCRTLFWLFYGSIINGLGITLLHCKNQ